MGFTCLVSFPVELATMATTLQKASPQHLNKATCSEEGPESRQPHCLPSISERGDVHHDNRQAFHQPGSRGGVGNGMRGQASEQREQV